MGNEHRDSKIWIVWFAISFLFILLSFCRWDYLRNKKTILENIDKQLFQNSLTLKYMIPTGLHDKVIKGQRLDVETDKKLAEKLTQFVKDAGVQYAYTIIKKIVNYTLFYQI